MSELNQIAEAMGDCATLTDARIMLAELERRGLSEAWRNIPENEWLALMDAAYERAGEA